MIRNSLKHRRISERISNAQLAQDIGISPSYVTKLENNEKQPSLDVMFRIAERFKCKVEDIFRRMPDVKKK
jgi:DNA-binding XRE family transcriptional regulator